MQHMTYFGQDHKKAPASASQTKIGHLNIERTEQPTDKHDKQLAIVSAKKLQGDIDDSIVSKHKKPRVDWHALKTFPMIN